MSELDEAAVAVATQASYDAWMATFGDPNTKLDDGDDEYQRSWRESTAAGITAYLAAAARSTTDAEAMERVSLPIDTLSDVLAWVELDDDLTEEMRMKLMVLGALVGDAISARTAVRS